VIDKSFGHRYSHVQNIFFLNEPSISNIWATIDILAVLDF